MKKFLLLAAVVSVFVALPVQAQFFFAENKNLGKEIPDFTLPSTTGENINLKEFRNGENTIVFFWATWCPHCRTQLKVLSQTQDVIAKQGIKIITVDYGEDVKTVQKYAKRNKIKLPMVVDSKTEYEEKYDLIGVPTFFFVNKEGIVKAVKHDLPEDLEKVFNL